MKLESNAMLQGSGPANKVDPKTSADAATEFESLLIGAMLKSMRESKDESWLGGDSSAGNESVMEMAEQQVSKAIARNGGFGIAKMLRSSFELERLKGSDPATAPKAGPQN